MRSLRARGVAADGRNQHAKAVFNFSVRVNADSVNSIGQSARRQAASPQHVPSTAYTSSQPRCSSSALPEGH
eukprot:9495009-Pyramimonas_sp.AAC.1